MAHRPITLAERTQWSALAHLSLLQCIGQSAAFTGAAFAFHGGTSLHLSWNSPRFSEDLDFLLSLKSQLRLDKEMERLVEHVREVLLLVDPQFKVAFKDKSSQRMGSFQVSLTKPGVLGTVMVKLEFWLVEPDYLRAYTTELRTPGIPTNLGGARIRIDSMLPAATLESAYYDKLTAFATRRHLKWRDLFDFWWLSKTGATPWLAKSDDAVAERLLHHLSAYKTVGDVSAHEALLRFAASLRDIDAVVSAAKVDLQPFLPATVWSQVWPAAVNEMVETAREGATQMASRLRLHSDAVETENKAPRHRGRSPAS